MIIKSIVSRLIKKRIINNSYVNPFLLFFKLDVVLNDYVNDYNDFQPDTTKSLFEIAGYSDTREMRDLFNNLHVLLSSTLSSYLKPGDKLLDIGCGPGLFLKDFRTNYNLTGIDINKGMTAIAKKEVPSAVLITGHFLRYQFTSKFNAVYTVGVLVYFNRGQIDSFFKKIHGILEEKGIAFISYPHAYRKLDIDYHDFTYVNYSPAFLERRAKKYFEIVYHKHINGMDVIQAYDTKPIANTNGFEGRTYQNSSVLILKRK